MPQENSFAWLGAIIIRNEGEVLCGGWKGAAELLVAVAGKGQQIYESLIF